MRLATSTASLVAELIERDFGAGRHPAIDVFRGLGRGNAATHDVALTPADHLLANPRRQRVTADIPVGEHEGVQQAELVERILSTVRHAIQGATRSAAFTVTAILGIQGVVIDVLEAREEPVVTLGDSELAQIGERSAVDIPGVIENVPVTAGGKSRMLGALGTHRGRHGDRAVQIRLNLGILEVEAEGARGSRQRQHSHTYRPTQQAAPKPAPFLMTGTRNWLGRKTKMHHCYTPDYYRLWIRYANAIRQTPGCQAVYL